MCGITGKYNFSGQINREAFNNLRDSLSHRGPDGAGTYFSEKHFIALGHRRLSIIGLGESGSQPMHNEDKSIWLTMNGEIYNYKHLRAILENLGHIFLSDTDSEVVIHGYEQWGAAVLEKLNGMFAIGIWDEKTETVFLARDRFGIKPLYYHPGNNTFTFASELKAIVKDNDFRKEPDLSSFADFLVYRYVPSPKTIWKNVFKIPPAHYLTFNLNKGIEIKSYWEPEFNNLVIRPEEAAAETGKLLLDSVSEHIVSDVPVGAFLSGGYDSSTIVHFLNKLNYNTSTFSIGFENWDMSEHSFAGIVSGLYKTKHFTKILDSSIFFKLNELMQYYDEPIADISILPTFELSRLAAGEVKTVLSGEGADEIFCGYTWHHNLMKRYNLFNRTILQNYLSGNKMSGINGYANAMAMGLFDSEQLREAFSGEIHRFIPDDPFWFYRQHYRKDLHPLKAFQLLDIKTFMGELVLVKVDRASMAHSLEVRVPFLSHRIAEFIFSLHHSVYYDNKVQKKLIHSQIKNHLPAEILSRKKQGFVGPDSFYMQTDFYRNTLLNSGIVRDNIIRKEYIVKLINSNDYWRLWKLAVLETWYSLWV